MWLAPLYYLTTLGTAAVVLIASAWPLIMRAYHFIKDDLW